MKETKNNSKNPDEHQAGSDCCAEIAGHLRILDFENARLSAQLDIILSSIEGGCSSAEAESLRQLNPGFLADMNRTQTLMDE